MNILEAVEFSKAFCEGADDMIRQYLEYQAYVPYVDDVVVDIARDALLKCVLRYPQDMTSEYRQGGESMEADGFREWSLLWGLRHMCYRNVVAVAGARLKNINKEE